MILFAIAAALLLLLPIAGFLPPIMRGDSEANNAFRVKLRPPGHSKFLSQPYEAVLSQEVVEWYFKWLVAILLAAVPAWLLRDLPAAEAFHVLLLFMATLWTKVPPLQRQFEYLGHAVEVAVAERLGHHGYVFAEARRMHGGYAGLFRHLSEGEIVVELVRRQGLARFFLRLLGRRIRRAVDA